MTRTKYTTLSGVPELLVETFHRLADSVPTGDGCRLWPGQLDRYGYGFVRSYAGNRVRHITAHRMAMLTQLHELPDWAVIDHLCRTPQCFRIEHLRLVTDAENIRCGNAAKPRPACKSGHPLSGDNLHIIQRADGRTTRACLACRREASRRYKERSRAS